MSTASLWNMAMAGWALIKSPRSMVRLAISPIPRPGIGVTLKGGVRVSWCEVSFFVCVDEKAGNMAILAAMEGLVKKEIPRPSEKSETVKTQNEVPLL